MSSLTLLHRINPEENKARFYLVMVGPTLLDKHAVIRVWGRIGGAQNTLITPYSSEEKANRLAEKLVQQKRKRGYALSGGHSPITCRKIPNSPV